MVWKHRRKSRASVAGTPMLLMLTHATVCWVESNAFSKSALTAACDLWRARLMLQWNILSRVPLLPCFPGCTHCSCGIRFCFLASLGMRLLKTIFCSQLKSASKRMIALNFSKRMLPNSFLSRTTRLLLHLAKGSPVDRALFSFHT